NHDSPFTFTVTPDPGPPPDTLEWPDSRNVAQLTRHAPRTTMSLEHPASGTAILQPASGPILSQTTLQAANLPPHTEVGLFFVTARGNRMGPRGWNLASLPVATGITTADGSLTATVPIPDDLGGWHTVQLVASDHILLEVPYYVEQSLVAVQPKRVKVGDTFTVQIKGTGWTELDNTVAVTYDNAAMGYACGFNSNGDVSINLVAS